ncbi:MAG: lipopolysaccharide biosynthesis protein [Candidatus Omnitrophota bacterium]|jgi:PST family polysaccharide transporter
MKLRQKIVQGFTWITLGELFSHALQLLSTIILARILLPENFGTIATAYIYIKLMQTIHQSLGLSEAIVQLDTGEDDISTAFLTYAAAGLLLSVITIILAPLVAAFFHNHLLSLILRVLSPIFLIDSLSYIFEALINKKLEYKRAAIPQLGGIIAYGLVGVILAFLNCGVWSLVWALLFKSLIRCFAGLRLCHWKPFFSFKIDELKKMVSFGKNTFGTGLFYYINENLDYLVIGKFLGALSLGYYFLAFSITHYFNDYIAPIFFKVLFPFLSRIHNEDNLLKEIYLKTVQSAALLSFPLYLVICINAKEFVYLIFGEKWLTTVLLLQILCIRGLLKSLYRGVTKAVVYAKGRPDISFQWAVSYCIVNCIFILLGLRYGIVGVAAAVTISEIICSPIIILKTGGLIGIAPKTYLKNIMPIVAATTIMVLLLVSLNTLFPEKMEYLVLKMVSVTVIYILGLKIMGINMWEKAKVFYKLAQNT